MGCSTEQACLQRISQWEGRKKRRERGRGGRVCLAGEEMKSEKQGDEKHRRFDL